MSSARHDADHGKTAPVDGAVSVWELGGRTLDFANRPLVMGVLNVTPDSFYGPSRVAAAAVADKAVAMADAGADLLDVGAESSRPGAEPIGAAAEQERLLPALDAIHAVCDLPLTVDTTRADTARRALDAGADGVNDITAGRGDPRMLPLVAETGCGLILMHMQGTPHTMQAEPNYDDVVAEVTAFLDERAGAAEQAGVATRRIALDPGIGFGKNLEHNLALLAALKTVARGRPLVLGASRKSFIGHLTGAPTEDRIGGSLAAVAAAHAQGAAVVRVHDVLETAQFLAVLSALRNR